MKRKTVFVLGAGASAEFGLPVGSELQETISSLLDIRFKDGMHKISGDNDILGVCRQLSDGDVNPYLHAGWLVRDGIKLSDSIDNFMDKHAQNERVQILGKLAIAKAICIAERESKLYVDTNNSYNKLDLSKLEDTWLLKLFRHLQRDVEYDRVERIFENTSFIVFNYDRCLEQFLVWALVLSYGIPSATAAEIVGSAEIYHPYGSLGNLPEFPKTAVGTLAFGESRYLLQPISERINTYAEQVRDGTELERARDWVVAANQIVFLGFAYHPQNMSVLTPSTDNDIKHVIGTAMSVSDYDRRLIETDIYEKLNPQKRHWNIDLTDSTCAKAFDDFGRAFF